MASILNNIGSLGAARMLSVNDRNLAKTVQRLTTGRRINNAADDAAGLVISNKLGSDVRTAAQGARNANDGVSYLQTADGVLDEVTNLLQRAAELAQQAASGTSGADLSTGKTALNAEFQNIVTTLADMQANTTFNAASVFGGSTVSVALGGYTAVAISVGTFNSLAGTDNLTTAANATAAAAKINTELNAVSALRGTIGASQSQLNSYSNTLGVEGQNWTASKSQIQDASIADEVVNMSKFQILNQSGISAMGKSNQTAQSIMSLMQ